MTLPVIYKSVYVTINLDMTWRAALEALAVAVRIRMIPLLRLAIPLEVMEDLAVPVEAVEEYVNYNIGVEIRDRRLKRIPRRPLLEQLRSLRLKRKRFAFIVMEVAWKEVAS